jgi:hypothetical protein
MASFRLLPHHAVGALSREVDTASREENALKQKSDLDHILFPDADRDRPRQK